MRGEFLRTKANFMIFVIIFATFTVYLANPASAQETTTPPQQAEPLGCCKEAKNTGENCVLTTQSECATPEDGFTPASCEQTSYCKTGCCVSSDGTCSTQVGKGTCESLEGYNWFDSANCELSQCQKGCCVLGGAQAFYTTEKKCKQTTAEYEALTLDFRTAVGTEFDCLNIVKQQDEGCCVTEEGKGTFTTRESCPTRDYDPSTGVGFFKDTFCSNKNLETGCKPHAKQDCIEGNEEVYWFDSCGNREEIVEETIDGSQNAAQNGDCDYATGTLCGKNDDGKAVCKDLNCPADKLTVYKDQNYAFQGQDRSNGESWCMYDAKPGVGSDPVGSRHYQFMCANGEEIVTPCADARQEVCINGLITDFPTKGKDTIEARCKQNNKWETCVTTCNTAGQLNDAGKDQLTDAMIKDEVCCKRNPVDCVWIGWGENIGKCQPLVAPGSKFWSGETTSIQKEPQCEQATYQGKTVWKESLAGVGDYKCAENCELYTDDYLTLFNNYCNSMGDCGAQYNLQGIWTNDGLYRTWDKTSDDTVELNDKKYTASRTLGNPETWNIKTEPPGRLDIGEGLLVYSITGEELMHSLQGILGKDWAYETLSKKVVGGGVALGGIVAVALSAPGSMAAGYATESTFLTVGGAAAQGIVTWAAVAIAAFFVAYGYFKGGIAGMDRRTTVIIGGYIAAATAIGAAASIAIAGCLSTCWTGYGAIAAAVIAIVAFSLAIFAGDETRMVTIQCAPWQPPVKEYDCASCDSDPKKQCSEYRCKAIGQNCKFIPENEGTNRPACYNANPDDVNSPKITDRSAKIISHKEDISPSFQLVPTEAGAQLTGFKITPNVPPYSKVVLEVETNELSQCKIGTELPEGKGPYAVLPNFMPDSYYNIQHNYTVAGVIPEKEYHYYIACQDPSGNAQATVYGVQFTVDKGNDLTPPQIIGANLKDNAYMAAGTNETIAVIYVDEQSPLECKWSKEDKDFNLMESNMSCLKAPMEATNSRPAECGAKLQLGEKISRFFFRCKDYPLEYAGGKQTGNVLSSNVMQESFKLSLQKTDPLVIQQTSPEGKLYTNNVTMVVRTQVGAESGKATCYYNDIMFAKTNDSYHEQNLANLPTGSYKYDIECRDVAGNKAEGNITFSVDVDTAAPSLTGISLSGNTLKITTSEPSTCQYSNSSFLYGQGTQMPPDNSAEHSISANVPRYSIICTDSFGNKMPEARIVLFSSIS